VTAPNSTELSLVENMITRFFS